MEENKVMKRLILFICLSILSLSAFSQKIESFDTNGDDLIGKSEYLKFLFAKKKIPFETIDENSDGALTDDELELVFADDLLLIGRNYGGFPVKVEYLVEKVESKTSGFLKRNGILIRSNYDEISLDNKVTPFSKGDPAVFSYSRNKLDTTSIWTAQGAIMRPFEILKNDSNSADYIIAPSVSFNRKISSNEKGEANSLIFRLGGSSEWHGKKDLFWNTRLAFAYATDFDFDADVWAVELEFEPSNVFKGMGVYQNFNDDKEKFNVLRYTWRIYGHFEIGNTSDVGSNEILEDGSFTRVGLKGEFGLMFRERVELKTKLAYLYGLSGEPDNSELISIKSIYRLDDTGHLTLNFEYQKGNIPLLQQEVDNWTFGLGIKF